MYVHTGPDVVSNASFLTHNMENFVTWSDTSKIKQHLLEYNEEWAEFDLDA